MKGFQVNDSKGTGSATAAKAGAASAQERADLHTLTAVQALDALANGTLRCETYVQALLERAREHQSLNAWITLNAAALTAARAVDDKRAAGATLGPLAGLPLLVKDNIDTQGLRTTAGTRALADAPLPTRNAPVLQKLLDAGAIVLAKANMHELAFGSTSSNAAYGFVRNPYAPDRVPGGSSGGTAAGLAARLAPAGLGTDTGASVRHPASFCGIVALRPSLGNGGPDRRYSGDGVAPISLTRDTVGCMARDVADVALLDAVITDSEPALPATLAGLRLGLPRGHFWESLDHEVEAIVEDAVRRLREAGVVFVEADLPGVADLNAKVSMPVALWEFYHRDLPAYLAKRGLTMSMDALAESVQSPDVRGVFEFGKSMPKAVYDDAVNVYRPQLVALYRRHFEQQGVDGVLFPTVPIPPPLIDPSFSGQVEINGVAQPGGPGAQFQVFIRNVDPGSNAGIPGLAQPAGMTRSGLPVGLEIDGPLGSDRRLLSIGLAIEQVLGLPPAPAL